MQYALRMERSDPKVLFLIYLLSMTCDIVNLIFNIAINDYFML
jgi:hypothetical protein